MTKKSSATTTVTPPTPRSKRLADREAELEKELQRIRGKRLEEEAETALSSNKAFQQATRELLKTRKKLTLQRVGRARKRDSIKSMQKRIEKREIQIAQHDQAEAVLEQELAAAQARVDELRKQYVEEMAST